MTFSKASVKGWNVWWSSLFLVEGILIFLGNAVTIAVFWKRRFVLKRALYLLINLAFADFLVGIGVTAIGAFNFSSFDRGSVYNVALGYFIYISATASICSLTVAAVERAFAIAKPLKHRTTSTVYYYRAICFVWVVATLGSILFGLYTTARVHEVQVPIALIYTACILLIVMSYFTIWWFTSKRSMEHMHGHQQNRKLATTLFIVTVLSLLAWLPIQVLMLFPTEDILIYSTLLRGFAFLEYANSLLNPFVYVLRMPEFRREIKRFCGWGCCQSREEVISMADVRVGHVLRAAPSVHIDMCAGAATAK